MGIINDIVLSGADFVPVNSSPYIPAIHNPEVTMVPIEQ